MNEPKFDPALYRDAMSRYAGHVQIVTTTLDGARRGVTITAACSVSDNPASVLVCLNNGNPNNRIFFDSGIFALNTLAFEQRDLADAFSGRTALDSDARFALGAWQTLDTGAPVLSDAPVAFDCRVIEMTAMSTHTVLFGAVAAIHFGPHNPALLYLDRGYRAL